MAPSTPSKVPKDRDEALKLHVPSDLQQAADTMKIAAPIMTAAATSVKEVAAPLVEFADAAKRLKEEAGFDLQEARENAVKNHTQWGIVEALQKKGLVNDADAYGALFDQAAMSETGLAQLITELKQGKSQLPLFDANLLSDAELFRILIEEAGIPFWNDDGNVYQCLSQARIIDPSQVTNLANLNRYAFWKTHLAAFKDAYEQAKPWKPGVPRLVSTLDTNEVGKTNIPATESAQNALAKGVKFTTLGTDLLRFRTQLDRGLKVVTGRDPQEMKNNDYQDALIKVLKKPLMGAAPLDAYMPDRQNVTQYPLEVLPDGSVLLLFWGPDDGRVYIHGLYPSAANDVVGQRSLLA